MNNTPFRPTPLDAPVSLPRCHFLFNGLGAGNIGDEAMFAGFGALFHMEPGSTIEVYDAAAPIVGTLPPQYEYITWTDKPRTDAALRSAELVLLVGDTLVSELHGVDWPLRAIGARVGRARELGRSVHGVAIGVDRLRLPEARRVFEQYHSHLSTWTTRSEACRDALIDLGVAHDRIAVAADLAWCCPVGDDVRFEDELSGAADIVGINIVGEDWAADEPRTQELARAFDAVVEELGVRIAFICNETRRHAVYDYDSAERIAEQMTNEPILLEPHYLRPEEQIARLRGFRAIVSQRYHLGLMGVLAQRPVGLFERGQKLGQLVKEIRAPSLGPHDAINPELIVAGVKRLVAESTTIVEAQQRAKERLQIRAAERAGFFLRRPG